RSARNARAGCRRGWKVARKTSYCNYWPQHAALWGYEFNHRRSASFVETPTSRSLLAAPPQRGPEITGLSMHYAVGENVTANCTAWPSVPKANLRWTINGEPVKYLSAFPVLVNFSVHCIDVLH
ncbi:hypothetical protein ALC62_13549, partial [Cyphomyrmex costatus]